MKRRTGHVVSVLATGIALSALAPACVENDQSIFIRAALAPSTNRQQGRCTYTDDPQQPVLLGGGDLDLGVRDNYVAVFLVGNQMIPRGDPAAARAESMRVHLEGGVVRVTEPNGALIREFTSYGTGFADPQNNNAPDFGAVGFIVLDAPTTDILRPSLPTRFMSRTVHAHVKVFGRTVGGKEVETDEFLFPVRVCNGCSVIFPGEANDAAQPGPNCLIRLNGPVENAPCNLGQDEATDCRLCIGRDACDPLKLNGTTP